MRRFLRPRVLLALVYCFLVLWRLNLPLEVKQAPWELPVNEGHQLRASWTSGRGRRG